MSENLSRILRWCDVEAVGGEADVTTLEYAIMSDHEDRADAAVMIGWWLRIWLIRFSA